MVRPDDHSIQPFRTSSSKKHMKSHCTPTVVMTITEYSKKHFLYRILNFLSKTECHSFIQWSEMTGYDRCDFEATRCTAERRQDRLSYDDSDGLISCSIFNRIKSLLPASIDGLAPYGCSRNIRMYKYRAGDLFSRHIDESNIDPITHAVSKLTLLIYLNGGGTEEEEDVASSALRLKGGLTSFYSSHTSRAAPLVSVAPEEG